MNELLQEKLRIVASLLFAHEAFESIDTALQKLTSDYQKGYPTDEWIDGLVRACGEGRLRLVTWDAKSGNYGWIAEKKE